MNYVSLERFKKFPTIEIVYASEIPLDVVLVLTACSMQTEKSMCVLKRCCSMNQGKITMSFEHTDVKRVMKFHVARKLALRMS
jgi:hypothetical protein